MAATGPGWAGQILSAKLAHTGHGGPHRLRMCLVRGLSQSHGSTAAEISGFLVGMASIPSEYRAILTIYGALHRNRLQPRSVAFYNAGSFSVSLSSLVKQIAGP